jgi:hypothetical protein
MISPAAAGLEAWMDDIDLSGGCAAAIARDVQHCSDAD